MNKDKKDKKKKIEIKHIQIPDNEEDIEKFLSEIEGKNAKVQIIGFSINIVKNPWLNILIYLSLNSLFITASYCIFQPIEFKNYWFLPVFIITFTVFDYLLKYIIYKYFQKLIFYSVTTIFILQDIIAIVLASLLMLLFKSSNINVWMLIASFISFLLVRFIVTTILKRKKA